MVEVSNRTIQGRYLLEPSERLTKIILGVLARAQDRYKMIIHAFVFLSNHYHMLLSAANSKQLADFMCFVDGNIAKEAGTLVGWEGRFWSRRYQSIIVDEDEETQVSRLRYVLSNSCKEGLVASPRDWTGASVTKALLTGAQALIGIWCDRTKEYRSRRARKPKVCSSTETVTLSPLPCWSNLTDAERQKQVLSLVWKIEEETARMHREQGTSPLGMEKVLRRNPHDRPKSLDSSPAPLFHTATREALRILHEAYGGFVESYRDAAARLRAGELHVAFPSGSFPPPLPFILAHAPG